MAERFAIDSNPLEVVANEINKTFDGLNDALINRRQKILAELNRKYDSSITNLNISIEEKQSLPNAENILSFCNENKQELELAISTFGKIIEIDLHNKPDLKLAENECLPQIDIDNATIYHVYNIPKSEDVVYHEVEHGTDASQVLINFYSIITNALYHQIEVITLRIGHTFFGTWDKNYILFRSISTRTVDGRVFHLLAGQFAVPIACFDHGVLRFPYKYCLYMKGKNKIVWEYHHKSATNKYNRFFEFILESSDCSRGYTTNVYDLPIFLHENANTKYKAQRIRELTYFFREDDEDFRYISNNRRFLALAMYTPYFYGIGEPKMGNCSNVKSFINAFQSLLYYLVTERVLQTNLTFYQQPVKLEYTVENDECTLVITWIKHILEDIPRPMDNSSKEMNNNNIAICHIIAILFIKYSLKNKNITRQWLDIIINCFDCALKENYFGMEFFSFFECSFSEIKLSYDRMLFDLAYHRFSLIKSLYAIPLYHILFDSQKNFNVCKAKHNYSDTAILGLPTNCSLTIFQHVTIEQFLILWKRYSTIDPLLVYTIVGSAKLTEKFVRTFSTLNNAPLIVYIIVLLFRINNNYHILNVEGKKVGYVNVQVRNAIYEEIILKVTLELTSLTGEIISIANLMDLLGATFVLFSNLPLEDTTNEELVLILRLVQQQLFLIEKLHNNYFDHHENFNEHYNPEKLYYFVNKVVCFLYPLDISQQYAKTTNEFLLWNHLIILEFPNPYGWKKIVEIGLTLRIFSLGFDVFQVLLLRILAEDGTYDERLKIIFSENMNDRIKNFQIK